MILLSNDAVTRISIDRKEWSIDDGRFIIDPELLPPVCVRCGGEGIHQQRLRVQAAYDLEFWLSIGGLLGGPLLFGIGAALVYLILGNDALANYVPYGVGLATVLAVLGGFRLARSNRENWFLTFYLCPQCEARHERLTSIRRLYGWGVLILLLVMMTLAVIEPALRITPDLLQLLMWYLLIGVIFLLTGFIAYGIQRTRYRGLNARWTTRPLMLAIAFKNHVVAEMMKSSLSPENTHRSSGSPGTAVEEEKDNDAIYKKLKQIIKEDGSAELDVHGREAQLLGRLGLLTQQRFLEQIEPLMTPERARYVRALRVDEGLTWRGIAEAWEKEFAADADWKFGGNQLAGMALCEAASKLFAENYMGPPWN